MRNYNKNLTYFSLVAVFVLFGATNLHALESKPLNDEVEFGAQVTSAKADKQKSVELVSDSSYNAQPVVHVEDTSVEDSTAVKMRKRREEAEVRTEQKIAESLEKARLADEQRRAERLFGNKIQPAHTTTKPPVAKPPAIQLAPQNNQRLNAIENSLSEIKTNLFNQEFDKLQQDSGKYVGLDLGTGKYVDSVDGNDVTTQYVFGISTGMRVEDNPFITLEGHFLFSQHSYKGSNFDSSDSYFPQVNQYNGGLSLKYDIVPFIITPRLGASIDYTFRQYYMESSSSGDNNTADKLDTHSVEVALMGGGYIQISKNLGIEVSYRQMMNVSTSARNNSYNPNKQVSNNSVKLLDKSSYGLFLISLQMGFQ